MIETVSFASLFPGLEDHSITLKDFRYPHLDLDHLVCHPTSLCTLLFLTRHSHATRIFEIGTNLGQAAYQLAVNSSPSARVFTLDYGDSRFFSCNPSLRPLAETKTPRELVGSFFRDKPEAFKITQLYLEETDFRFLQHSMDLIYVDGDRSRAGIQRETELALELLGPRGMIVWDDYGKLTPVNEYLGSLSQQLPLYHLKATEVVVYRR